MIIPDYRPPYYNEFLEFKRKEQQRGVVSNIDYETFVNSIKNEHGR